MTPKNFFTFFQLGLPAVTMSEQREISSVFFRLHVR